MQAMIARYLARLGFGQAPPCTLDSLAELQLRHLMAVPFENLDVWSQRPVRVDPAAAIAKIVDRSRGGWCFELNAAFAVLLRSLGFEVLVLGAATLFDGPNDLVDHMLLEVQLDQPYLVDVGFGKHSPISPLRLQTGTHAQPHTTYELLASPKGTTLAWDDDGIPSALCRFKRVAHDFDDFRGASDRLQNNPTSIFRRAPFATKLIDGSGSRVTWSNKQLVVTHPAGAVETTAVPPAATTAMLDAEFGITGFDNIAV